MAAGSLLSDKDFQERRMYFLGIDIGSSFLKSYVLDLENKKVTAGGNIPTPPFTDRAPDGTELDPLCREIDIRALSHAVGALIDAAAEQYELAGVGFSVQMHGFMLFDPDGTPRTNYVTWQDLRGTTAGEEDGQSVLEELRSDAYALYFRENGVRLRPNHSVVPLLHYARQHEIPFGTQFAMIGDAVARMLTGTRAALHPTNAQSSGLYSVRENDWNLSLIKKLGLGHIDFPEVRDTKEPVAVYHSKYGNIPLFAGLGDQQATVLGIGCAEDDMFINIATGGQVGYVTKDPSPGDYETRPYFDGSYIRTITQLPSGRTVNVLMRFIKHIGREVFGVKDDEASIEMRVWDFIDSTDYDRLRVAPMGMELSYFDPQGGMISGITGDNFSIENLIGSAYTEFAMQYAEKAMQLGLGSAGRKAEQDPGALDSAYTAPKIESLDGRPEKTGTVICTGGVIRKNKPLFAKLEAAMPLPCRISETKEDSMEGIMRYALWCLKGQDIFK